MIVIDCISSQVPVVFVIVIDCIISQVPVVFMYYASVLARHDD